MAQLHARAHAGREALGAVHAAMTARVAQSRGQRLRERVVRRLEDRPARSDRFWPAASSASGRSPRCPTSASLVRQLKVYDYQVVGWTNERCSIDFYRHGERLEPTAAFTDDDAKRAGLDRPNRDGSPSNHMKFPRNMTFARAMSNGVGLHCPDLTAGTPVYTPDDLGGQDADADVTPSGAAPPPADAGAEGGERAGEGRVPVGDLTDAAVEGGYSAATVVELCRFFYDEPRLTALTDEQAGDLAGRLRLARVQGVSVERLLSLPKKGLGMGDLPRARQAVDLWLTFRKPRARGDRPD